MNTMNRYLRQEQLPGFGAAAQQKLSKARVLVVGAGGLGVPVLQYLCAMGVGAIGIADGDVVSASNLHRQVLYAEADIGQPKVHTAAHRLRQLNSGVALELYDTMLDVSNAMDIIGRYDLVIDATDNFTARYLVNDACVSMGKPFVYGAIQQYEGQVSVFNYGDGPTYRCVFPVPPAAQEIPDCNTAGVLGVVPGIIGCWQALEAVKVITGTGQTLSGYLKIFDFAANKELTIKLVTNPANKQVRPLQEEAVPPCAVAPTSEEVPADLLSSPELFDWYVTSKEFLLLDVREAEEYRQGHLLQAQSVPLQELDTYDFPDDVPLVTFCRKGGRSQRAASILKEKNKALEVYSVAGGLDNWTALMGKQLIVV
jgi:adenylyltransferase/sulfurtransferase